MKLVPYLTFAGNCEEAFNHYHKIFNGTLSDISRFGDNPNPQLPDDQKNKIMHARLAFGDNMLMFSDTMPGGTVDFGNGISLSIGLTDEAEARSIFSQLAGGGKITMPMEKQFWGALFGMVKDRYGINWMINCEGPPAP
jgi:PhnB protein